MTTRPRRGLSFARRLYRPRAIGAGLSFFCIGAGIAPTDPQWWTWAVLFAYAFVWPHLAFQLANRANQPFRAEQRNLLLDGLAGGFWIGAMGLNLLPSAVILTMIAMDKIAAGGWRLLLKALMALVFGVAAGLLIFAPALLPMATPAQMLACLPMLLLYPQVIGLTFYRATQQLAKNKRILARLGQTDSLTGLITHGAWKDLLLREFTRSRSDDQQVTMALIDIDRFKHINETYGHKVGDAILRNVSATLSAHLRKTDLVGRYGGDQFCVILPEASASQTRVVLDRLSRAVNEFGYPGLPQLSVSLSIGIASYGKHQTTPDAWLHEADKALQNAKEAGRNTVTVAGLLGN